jgi:NADPH-dependent stearoyl-CoA 9-desaturase
MHQYMQTFWTILKLSVPNKFLQATSDDAPETLSELKFRIREGARESFGVDPDTGRRRGLRTALRELQTGHVATA